MPDPATRRTPEQMDELRRRVMLDIPEDYDQIAIASCPLCKGESRLTMVLRKFYARCTVCGCSGPSKETIEEAKQAWETRT